MISDGVEYHQSDDPITCQPSSWYAANNLVKSESALLQPLTKEMIGSSFTIFVCGQRISATVNIFAAINLGGVR